MEKRIPVVAEENLISRSKIEFPKNKSATTGVE